MHTETVVADAEFDVLMTGEERYPIVGGESFQYQVDRVMPLFKGLPLYAGCWEKALITQSVFGGEIQVGAMRVVSATSLSAYGFDFNPPNELHCWVTVGNLTIDLSLPGVILRGLKMVDEYGPVLEGREPSILFGSRPNWLLYQPRKAIYI